MLKIIGRKEIFNGELVVVEGGFGKDKKAIFDIQIAEIHNVRNIHVREAINKMISRGRMRENIDYIDIKKVIDSVDNNIIYEFYSKMEVAKSKSIFVLSERGYTKLIKLMNDDKSWDIMEKMIDEYFTMRALINSKDNQRNELLLQLFSNDPVIVASAHKQLVALESQPLIEKIDKLKPLAEKYNIFLDIEGLTDIDTFSKQLAISNFGRNTIYNWLRDNKYLQDGAKKNLPYAKYVNINPIFKVKNTGFRIDRLGNKIPTIKTYLTAKGVDYFLKKFVEEGIISEAC